MNTPILAVGGLGKRYGSTIVLGGVDMRIDAGQISALVGPNGAGKSTLTSIVAGTREPDTGSVALEGIDAVRHRRIAASRIGYAPQTLGVYPVLTARDNLRFFASLRGVRGDALHRDVDRATELARLETFVDHQVRFLSGGQQRRLHAAVALLGRPALLLLDEPTAGVDVDTRAAILDTVRFLAAEGAAICYVTHYLTEVESLDAHVVMLADGDIQADGSVDELLAMVADDSIELVFDGPPPDAAGLEVLVRGQETLLLNGKGLTLARLLSELGSVSERVTDIHRHRANLEQAYRAILASTISRETAHVQHST